MGGGVVRRKARRTGSLPLTRRAGRLSGVHRSPPRRAGERVDYDAIDALDTAEVPPDFPPIPPGSYSAWAVLLADVIALILTGRRFPVMAYTQDREELRKRITSLAVEEDRMVLLDNLAGPVGNDILDAALTSDRWKDRILGANRVYDGPLHVSWFATGNNVQLAADTARRICHIRLETPAENLENRSGFQIPDLRRHVRDRRGELLSAALRIVKGWLDAGRPSAGLTPWGSYEDWSGVVREVVVFAGLPDPGETGLPSRRPPTAIPGRCQPSCIAWNSSTPGGAG